MLFCTGRKLDRDRVAKALRARLPHYMMPDRIETVRTMPLNRNGKIDRHALAALGASA